MPAPTPSGSAPFPRIRELLNQHTILLLAGIVSVYLLLGVVYIFVTPVFEKPDENWHFAYIAYMLDHHELPPLDADVAINPAEQIAGHPPLYYGLASLLLALTEQPHHPISPEHNLVLNVPLLGTTKENKNQFIHPPGELLDPGNRPTYLLRLFSLILGIGAIVGGFGIARTMGLSGALSLAAAAGIAITPQFIFIAGSISNDALTATLSALSLWMLLAALDKDRWWRWMLASILIGLTALTKTSGLALAGVGVAATLTAFWRDRAVGRGILRFAAVASVPLMMVGWWYLRNAFLFHDPLATQIHHLKMAREAPLAALQIIQQWPIIERSFWAAFGWGNILYDDAFYLSFRLAEIIALAGLMLLVLKREALARRAGFWLLLLFIGALVFSLGLWTRSLWGSWGRLLFPGISAIMVMMMMFCCANRTTAFCTHYSLLSY